MQRLERPTIAGLGGAAPDGQLRRALVELQDGDRVVERQRRHELPARVGLLDAGAAGERAAATPASRVPMSLITRRSCGLRGFLKGEQTIWKTRLS